MKRIYNNNYRKKKSVLYEELTEALSNFLLGEMLPLDIFNAETGEIIIPANRRITKTLLRKVARYYDYIDMDPSPIRNKIREIISSFENRFNELELKGLLNWIPEAPRESNELIEINEWL